MQVNRTLIQATVKQIKAYFENRSKLPEQANSNEGCTVFSANDIILTTLCNEISDRVTAYKLPSFGAAMYRFSNSSTLLKKCCDCPNAPNPFRIRNAARVAAETSLKTWMLNAEKHFNENGEIGNEQSETIIVGRSGKLPIKYIK